MFEGGAWNTRSSSISLLEEFPLGTPGNYFAMSETDDLGNEDIGSAPWAYLSNAYPKASTVIFLDTKAREWLRG